MKIRESRMFPYPVLSSMNDDYIDSEFKIFVKAQKNRKVLRLEIVPFLRCETLASQIKENMAEMVVHFECGRTRYRKVRKLSDGVNYIDFEGKDLNENLQIIAFIVAREQIFSIKSINTEFNSDYDNTSFNIEKGAILAISNQLDIPIDKSLYNFNNVTSIVQIHNNPEGDKNVRIDLSDSLIRILLPAETYKQYSTIGKSENIYTPILHSIFVIPALIYCLDYLKNIDDWIDVENLLWFKVIKKKCEEIYGEFEKSIIEDKTSVVIAQELIGNPVGEATSVLLKMEDKNEN